MISETTIEQVKERSNLVDIISESITLKRQGSGYVGLCPFHGEKTPSFNIRDGGKFYHCFGCGVSGNAISFLMQMRGISFPQAVEELANRYNIPIVTVGAKEGDKKTSDKRIFFEATQQALLFFHEALKKSSLDVKTYLKERGLNLKSIEFFGIGFSPLDWNALTQFLRKRGISDETMLTLGLARRNSRGELYDALRGRLIFPIWNDSRKVAGFGGRIIPKLLSSEQAESAPKYINSPESPIYHKSHIFFGLPQAISSIREKKALYVVEGYMDVIGLSQIGNVQNVIATCGTALTENHAKRLALLSKRVSILFDGDGAGRNAAAKSFPTFLNCGVDVDIIFLPEGEDPDSFSRKHGNQTLQQLDALPKLSPLECYIDSLLSRFSATSAKTLGAALKGQLSEEVASWIRRVKNPVEQDELLQRAAFRINVDRAQLLAIVKHEKPSIKIEQHIPNELPISEANHSSNTYKPLNSLPRLDKEILLPIMAYREKLTKKVLSDATLARVLQTSTMYFIDSLDRITSKGNDEITQKGAIKSLLEEFGISWLEHWRKAFEMSCDLRVNLYKVFDECCEQVRKDQLIQTLKEVDKQILASPDENTREKLENDKLILRRKFNAFGNLAHNDQ